MSGLSHVELELVRESVHVEGIHDLLVKGCWVEKNDHRCIISLEQIEFTGGFHDSYFKISLKPNELLIESDSPWELEVLAEELKELAVKKAVLTK
ncbi:hypothetical protein DYI25_08800 [Mesobacillus boroniphilus]|uniref:Uncharacterized protein n=1 Tax=Mesobacillus boroniphilus TaxID=308892 RepID=A0A944GWB5_9BACI|nr:hypothetical protein [Mesobacillus boroniphilus]MBS8264532.1 hypothetical protein [Mesobacillus boroniphilus]